MRKKNKGVLILLVILILLVAVYFILRTWNTKQTEKERETGGGDSPRDRYFC